MIFRKMTLSERIFGRTPDTDDVVVYKNYTLRDWFFGRLEDRNLRLMTAIQRTVGVIGIVIIFVILLCLV